ncbi:MAG: 30S ribosome-binding factor RbfA [Planctomycetota bacterium]
MSWDRLQKLQTIIKQKVALIVMRRLSDPRLGFVTITRTQLARDKSECRVYFSVLGDSAARRKTQRALDDARGHIQAELGKTLRTRTLPHLTFVYDESIEGAIRVSETLKELAKERDEGEGKSTEPPPTER